LAGCFYLFDGSIEMGAVFKKGAPGLTPVQAPGA
jgi:hypothetical protein